MNSAPLILPVGHQVGADAGRAVHQIRLGPAVHSLTPPQYAVWTLAHGTPDVLGTESRWQRDSVQDLAPDDGSIDALLDLGLLVEVAPDSEQALEFARTHRIIPLMLGLGNSPDDPSLFGIGLLHQPVLKVTHPIYDLWQWSTVDDTLWTTCENAADVARRAGSVDPELTEPHRLLTGFLGSLHALVLAGAACIDIPVRLDSLPAW
ncbi:MAG TPA: hypothetical protein VHC49_23510 [Mycobacteriales bacterium]|nr:hypothetical protein [Mycobacteriales bacterium]